LQSTLSSGPDEHGKLVELAKLFAAFPAARDGETNTRLRAESYVEALTGLPVWAIAEARKNAIRGTMGDSKFCPSSGELANAVRHAMEPVKDELVMVNRVLNAEVDDFAPSDEERARVGKAIDALHAEVKGWADKASGKERPVTNPRDRLTELARLAGNSLDFDLIPDAPERTGSFGRLSGS